jgi:hypothetical protein
VKLVVDEYHLLIDPNRKSSGGLEQKANGAQDPIHPPDQDLNRKAEALDGGSLTVDPVAAGGRDDPMSDGVASHSTIPTMPSPRMGVVRKRSSSGSQGLGRLPAKLQRVEGNAPGETGEPNTIGRKVYDLLQELRVQIKEIKEDHTQLKEDHTKTRDLVSELNTRMQVVKDARASADNTRERLYYLKNTPMRSFVWEGGRRRDV